MLEYAPHFHEYRDGDSVIPSVTQILKATGYIGDFYSAEAAERGAAVHELCSQVCKGFYLDGTGRKLHELEYVNAFCNWFKGYEIIGIERIIDHAIDGRRYAGRYDLLIRKKRKTVLVDIKTGAPQNWHGLQLAAYALAVNPSMCMNLYLKPDGVYRERYLSFPELAKAIAEWKEILRRPLETKKPVTTGESWL
jgi:hypothetical protein